MAGDKEESDDDIAIYKVQPESPRMRILLYSEPGAGKTTLASTAQDHDDLAPVLYADVEGVAGAVGHRDDIHAVKIASTDDLRKLYYALLHKKGDFAEVQTLVIDNATELQTLNLDEIVHEEMSKDSKRKSEDEIWQEDYGVSTVQLLRLFRWFKGLDINLIITAHAKFVYPKTDSRNPAAALNAEPLAVLPMLTQKLCKQTMGLVDYVWFLNYDAEGDKRQMLTRPDGIYQAKTRGQPYADLLGAIVDNPTMPMLYDALLQSRGGGTTTKKKRRK